MEEPDLLTIVANPIPADTPALASARTTARSGGTREASLTMPIPASNSRGLSHVASDSMAKPAFLTSELYAAFALGFAVFLPFLIIDLVVANVLLALGMQMLSPTQVSLPFKLLLFVAIDGWGLLSQALVTGYRF